MAREKWVRSGPHWSALVGPGCIGKREQRSFPPSAFGSHDGGSSSSSSSSSFCHRHPVLEAGGLLPKEGEEGGGGREQSPTWFTWDHMRHTHRSPSPSPTPRIKACSPPCLPPIYVATAQGMLRPTTRSCSVHEARGPHKHSNAVGSPQSLRTVTRQLGNLFPHATQHSDGVCSQDK